MLWGYSHQTLVRHEPRILRQAGFDVVVEEPERFTLREGAFVEYPIELHDKVGARLRLSARGGKVAPDEERWANENLDAILVSGPLQHAANIAEWFQGAVLFRWFGSPSTGEWGVKTDAWPDPDSAIRERMIGVAAFSGLLGTMPRNLFAEGALLRATAPELPITHSAPPRRAILGIFLGYLEAENWTLEFLRTLSESVGVWQIRVFAASPHLISLVDFNTDRFEFLVRLSDAEYWRSFQECSLIVYPHEYRYHSHYIPLEAIEMGIPVLVSSKGAFAKEVSREFPAGEDVGICSTRTSLLTAVARLVEDPFARESLSTRQQLLLKPFSLETVRQQAAHLYEEVKVRRTSAAQTRFRLPKRSVGVPTLNPLVSTLRTGLNGRFTVSASSIAVPVRVQYAAPLHAEFSLGPDGGRTDVVASGTGDFDLSIGVLSIPDAEAVEVRLHTSLDSNTKPPCRVEYGSQVLNFGRYDGRSNEWVCTGVIEPNGFLKVRVVGALMHEQLRVRSISISAVRATSGKAEFTLARGRTDRVWVGNYAQTARLPRGLSWMRRRGWAAVRMPLSGTEGESLGVRAEVEQDGGLGLAFLATRRTDGRIAPLAVLVGRWLVSRRAVIDPGDVPIALGTVRGLRKLNFVFD